jgi:hypothetical protein
LTIEESEVMDSVFNGLSDQGVCAGKIPDREITFRKL